MAFDLNKNDGSTHESSLKKPAISKFDLSKQEVAGAVAAEKSSKSKMWMVGLVGVLIIGGGIWYYSFSTKTPTSHDVVLKNVAPSDSVALVPTAQNAKVQKDAVIADTVIKDTSIASLPAQPTVAETPIAKNVPVKSATTTSGNNDIKAKFNRKTIAQFRQGSTFPNYLNQSVVRGIISYLAENPAAAIQVNGYASSDGSLEINQTISQKRADAFKKYLVTKSIAENRVVAVGKGIENPIASNNTTTGRTKNRRVEITFP